MNIFLKVPKSQAIKNISSLLHVVRQFANDSAASAPPKFEKTINTVTLMGRVGAEPQKRGNQEHPVVTFSLATANNYKYETGDWNQRTDWHRVVVFKPGLRDAVMTHLKKGQRTLVNGRISYGEITDQDGKQRLSTSIIADDVIFLQTNV